MKVYFGANGIGLGHVGRCIPIAKRLHEMGNDVAFSTYKEAIEYVKRENIPVFNAPAMYFAVRPDGGVDFRQTTANPGVFSVFIFLKQLRAEIEFLKSYNPDLVVSDSRISTIVAALLLGIPVITILNLYRITIPRERRFLRLATIADGGILTVIGKIWTMSRIVLIPDFPQPYTLSQNNLGIPPSREKKIRLIGPVISTMPDDLPDVGEIRGRLGLDDRPLIFVPISGQLEERAYLIGVLKEILRNFPSSSVSLKDIVNPPLLITTL